MKYFCDFFWHGHLALLQHIHVRPSVPIFAIALIKLFTLVTIYVTHTKYFLYTPEFDVSESSMQNKARANSFEDYNILLSLYVLKLSYIPKNKIFQHMVISQI